MTRAHPPYQSANDRRDSAREHKRWITRPARATRTEQALAWAFLFALWLAVLWTASAS